MAATWRGSCSAQLLSTQYLLLFSVCSYLDHTLRSFILRARYVSLGGQGMCYHLFLSAPLSSPYLFSTGPVLSTNFTTTLN